MTRLCLLGSAVLCLALMAGCAKDQAASAKAKPSYFEDQRQTITATVEAVDQKTRMITLRGEKGKAATFKVDDQVRNLDQIKVGDRVAVGYYESIAIHVLPPGEPVNETRLSATRAAKGDQPGAMAAQHTTLTATVEGVDKDSSEVTLRGPAGNLRTIMVRDPKKLKNIKAGDRLQITYTETLAVDDKPAPSPAAPAIPPAPSSPAAPAIPPPAGNP
jgi:Cu/Ag efflux protein CusF